MHECYQSEKKKTWAEFVHFKTWRHRFASGIKRRRHNCSEDKFVIYILPPWLCSVSVFSELSTLFVCVCVCVTQKQVEMCPSTKQRPGFSHPTAVPPRKINSSPVVVCSSACVYIWECVFESTFFNCHNSFYNTVPLLWPVFGAESDWWTGTCCCHRRRVVTARRVTARGEYMWSESHLYSGTARD